MKHRRGKKKEETGPAESVSHCVTRPRPAAFDCVTVKREREEGALLLLAVEARAR